MANENEANWALLGEALVAFSRRPPRMMWPLPKRLHRVPGPVILLAERFVDSPIGPFMTLSIGEPVRFGLRFGYFFGLSVVNSADARRLGRQYWGFPHELGTLRWATDIGTRTVTWEERGIQLSAEVPGRPLPILLPLRSLQTRSDGPVIIPTRLRSMARRCRVTVTFDEADQLLALGGRHRGLALSGMLMRRSSARHGSGLIATFRAPIRSVEPGVLGMKSEALETAG